MDLLTEMKHVEIPNSVGDLFKGALPNFKCSICSSEDFIQLDDLSVPVKSTISMFNTKHHSLSSILTYGIACQNCGFVHQFLETNLHTLYLNRLGKKI